ncbi:hypothetical protein ACVDFE_41105 [Lentzea chajnantorensis]
MTTRLAFGVTAGPGLGCWPVPSGGPPVPGAPVALGPAGAAPAAVRAATGRLDRLVRQGGEVAAGAGVDLGGGFHSARLAGAHGDRRDAVLAALRCLGADGAHRLGDRTAVLVALFGEQVTKRVGAAAHRAVTDGRWAAVQLASAASDLLGPEQLERVLDLRAPEDVDPFPRGAASTVAGHLSRVLAAYPKPRRLKLVLDLWDHVCGLLLDRQRRARLVASQVRTERLDELRDRHREHFDAKIVQHLTWDLSGQPVTLANAARWQPPKWWTASELEHLLHDAIAATALLRFARTTSDEGFAVAVDRHRAELVAADACLTERSRTAATHRPDGAYNHPARPGAYVHRIVLETGPDRTVNARTEGRVRTYTAMARNYGVVVFEAVERFLDRLFQPLHHPGEGDPGRSPQLAGWRREVGYPRAPQSWEQPPLADTREEAPTAPLAQRLAGADPADVELPHDLLWFADLADALAPFHGGDSATVRHEHPHPTVTYDDAPAKPGHTSLPLAVAEVAQLVMFGAVPPPRCGSWAELVTGVTSSAVIAEADTGVFPIPPGVSAVDGSTVAGLTVELGREPRQLAEWSGYMGNCIGESWYADQARKGHCVLMALRAPDGRIAANLDVRRHTAAWHVHELRARFNDTVADELEQQVRKWVEHLPAPRPPEPEPVVPVPPVRVRGGSARRSAAGNLPAELVRALTAAVERELAGKPVVTARRAYAELARGLGRPGPADFEPDAAVVALKRVDDHVDLVRAALADGLAATTLWQATRVRPLAAAVHRLDQELRDHERLHALTGGAPLPRTLRALVRRPEIAPAHALDVVARSVRAAMGELLGDAALARSVARRPSTELVCALAIATTCSESTKDTVVVAGPRKTTVPGFPPSDLADPQGPWQQALPAAADLGAPVDLFWSKIAEHGLLIPAAVLGKGGWPALWARLHR